MSNRWPTPSDPRLFAGRRALAWAALCLVLLLFALIPALTPFVRAPLSGAIRYLFSGVCHQLPGRSFQAGGIPLAVCQRCWGLYVGLALGSLALAPLLLQRRAVRRLAIPLLLGAVALLGIDWTLPVLGIAESGPMSRFFTGLFVGISAAPFLTEAVMDWTGSVPPAAAPRITLPAPDTGRRHPTT